MSEINSTADIISEITQSIHPGSKAVSLGVSSLVVSVSCLVAYNSLRRNTPRLESTPVVSHKDVRISKLFVHPIKSCRGISVQQAYYTPEGLEHDRLWCIADATTHAVLTAREHAKMVLIFPSIEADGASPNGGALVVAFPEDSGCGTLRIPLRPSASVLSKWKTVNDAKLYSEGGIDGYICESLSAGDPSPSEVLSRYLDRDVLLLFKGPLIRQCGPTTAFPSLNASMPYQDGYPLLVLSEESLGSIEQELQNHIGKQGIVECWKNDKVVIERFRPNIVFSGGGPFAEDDWEEISIGGSLEPNPSAFSVVSLCARCMLPNVDNITGVRDPAVPYKVLMKFRLGLDPNEKYKPCVGCNVVPQSSGIVRVGDSVTVRRLKK